MILTAHQPVYLPWLGLFHKIALSDEFCYFDDVQYLKKDWNNRNKIKTSQGPLWLTVPVLTTGHREKPIREIEINNAVNWRAKHWRSIYLNYHRAPYFERYADYFEGLYRRDWVHLSALNEHMLTWLLRELGIAVKFHKASEFAFKGQKSDLVLDMCRQLGANTYVFGALGTQYADEADFNKAGINILFQDYKHPVYPQLHGDFVPHMSVIDLLFNCGGASREILMSGNITKQEVL
ncbi:MAG: hypothetical protein RLZZ416_531 [Candidatus Parcubacteria bacterium]|jgi:hypothetical protein